MIFAANALWLILIIVLNISIFKLDS